MAAGRCAPSPREHGEFAASMVSMTRRLARSSISGNALRSPLKSRQFFSSGGQAFVINKTREMTLSHS